MLEVKNISVFYGKVQALHNVSITVDNEEIVAIIGSNGAGKTTLMKTIMGICRPSDGQISYDGKEMQKLPPHKVVEKGVIYVPEGRKIFPRLSVRENLEMGAFSQRIRRRDTMRNQIEEVCAIFPKLKDRFKQMGGTLSGGEQQMLAIARGLMSAPKLLMLDEPSLGLAPVIVEEVFAQIIQINQIKHIPILLVEQNAYSSLEIASKAYVMEVGEVVKSGTGQNLLHDPAVIDAYLGGNA